MRGTECNFGFSYHHSMTEGECIIETDTGVFECGMDVQLDNLIRDIQSLCM